ncbi:MAG: alpha/beta fold hydrolase [Hyphomonadaceae bacterium]|nr:alpha/beta fold hydrolase [Hyphomonadaceae bacterium]
MSAAKAPKGTMVQAGDIELHCIERGAGDPIIMIHGGGPGASGWSNFNRNVEAFAQKHRVLIVDLPGYGASSKPALPPTLLGFYAGSIRAMMDTLKIERAHLVGNSLGGMTSLKFALEYPDRLDHLVLMGAGAFAPFSPMPTEGLKHLLAYYAGEGPTSQKLEAFVRAMVWDQSEITPQLIAERYQASIDPEVMASPAMGKGVLPRFEPIWRDDLSVISARTLLIWGRDDRVVPLDSSFLLLKQIRDCQLHVFAQCGHWAQWEKAPAFNRLVLDFLASGSRASPASAASGGAA